MRAAMSSSRKHWLFLSTDTPGNSRHRFRKSCHCHLALPVHTARQHRALRREHRIVAWRRPDQNGRSFAQSETSRCQYSGVGIAGIEIAGGNPRLLTRLDRVIGDLRDDSDAQHGEQALEEAASNFRRESYLLDLLKLIPVDSRRLIALLALFQRPLDRSAMLDIIVKVNIIVPVEPLVAYGLIEHSRDNATSESRYFVSSLLHPLVAWKSLPKRKRARFATRLPASCFHSLGAATTGDPR